MNPHTRTSAPNRTLLNAIADLTRIQREVSAVVAHDLACPRAALGIIRMLDRVGDSGVGELAAHLHVDISVASRQVGALVDEGLVERSAPDAPGVDRRTRTVRLTPAGHAFATETYRVIDLYATGAFASWTPDEVAAAAQQLGKVTRAIEAEHVRHTSAVAADHLAPAERTSVTLDPAPFQSPNRSGRSADLVATQV